MAYMNPRQYLDLLTRGQGGRVTAYQGQDNLLEATGDYFNRRSPNKGWRQRQAAGQERRAATGAYDLAAQQPTAAAQQTPLQQGLQDFGGALAQRQGDGAAPVQSWADVWAGGQQAEEPVQSWADVWAGGQQAEEPAAEAAGGPQSLMGKIGGFFKRPEVGDALTAFGSQMAQTASQPGASAWTSLATGADAASQSLSRSRALEQQQQEIDRTRTQEDEDRAAQKKVNDTIAQITSGWDETTTPEQRVSDLHKAANAAFSNGDAALGRALLEEARDTIEGPESGPAVRYKTWDQTEGRAPDGITPTRVREVEAGPPGTISDRQYFDSQLYTDQVSQGIDPAVAARNSWTTGGMIVDPVAARATADKEVTLSTQEKLNARLGEAAYDGLMLMVVDPATVDPETGETIPGQPNYADYYMAGATPVREPNRYYSDGRMEEGAITGWEQGSPGNKEGWQSFLASLISNAGSETSGFGSKLLGFFGRSVFLRDNPEILAGYTNALNYINPTVRFLSGAQMTNQEAMRYYNALIPAPGDPIEVIELKRRKRDVLTNAMGGPGISDAARQKAREDLNLDEDELMVHEYGAFGGDASGRDAADYYLARLIRAVGVTDMTDYGAVSGQVDNTPDTDDDDDPGAFVPRGGN